MLQRRATVARCGLPEDLVEPTRSGRDEFPKVAGSLQRVSDTVMAKRSDDRLLALAWKRKKAKRIIAKLGRDLPKLLAHQWHKVANFTSVLWRQFLSYARQMHGLWSFSFSS